MLRVQGKELDLRVSTVPTVHGEIGGDADPRRETRRVRLPHARLHRRVPAAVPSTCSSSRTASCWSPARPARARRRRCTPRCRKLNKPDVKIITVEDPVEYQIEGINQIQVKPQIGLDFAQRAALDRAPGSGHHHDRRNARPGNRAHRDPVGADRPPGAVDAAHQRRRRRHHPHARHGRGGLPADVDGQRHPRAAPGAPARCRRMPRRYAASPEEIEKFGLRRLPARTARSTCTSPRGSALAPTGYLGRTTIMEFLVMNDESAPRGHAPRRHGRTRTARAQGRHAHDVRGRPRQGAAGHDHDRGSPARHRRTR